MIGYKAGKRAYGTSNVGIGYNALYGADSTAANNTGTNNTAIGQNALKWFQAVSQEAPGPQEAAQSLQDPKQEALQVSKTQKKSPASPQNTKQRNQKAPPLKKTDPLSAV